MVSVRTTWALGLLATLVAVAPATAQNFDSVEIKATKVAGNVYMLVGAGGNIGASVGDDGILIVDDQFAPLAPKIRAVLKDIGGGALEFVLNTHWHGDHTGGNVEFGEEASIVAHTHVRDRMSVAQEVRGNRVPASPPKALPVITFDDAVSIHFNGEEVKMLHLPSGHTDGDSMIYFAGSNVLHLGDHFFAGAFPFVDLASGGNVLGLERNIAKAIEMMPADVKVIPGHGPLSTLDDLKRYHAMLEDCIAAVRKGVEAGKGLKEIQADGLPSEWSGWGGGFINSDFWTETIYKSLWQGMPAGETGG